MPDKPQSEAKARRKGAKAIARPKTKRAVKTGRGLALEVYAAARKAGVRMEAKGNWVEFHGKLPTAVLLKATKCQNELARVVREKQPDRMKAELQAKKSDTAQRVPTKAKQRAGAPAHPSKKTAAEGPAAPPKKKQVFKASEPMENGQWETFAQKMAMGVFSNYSCYLQAYPESSAEAARRSASELLTNPDIKARIAWIRAEALKNVNITLEEQLLWYIRVKDTPVGFVDDESPMAQKVKRTIMGTEEEGTITKVEVETPCKMAAAKQIDKLKGFEKPQELNVNLGYEPPGKAMERLTGKGVDLAAILKKAGLMGK